MRCTMPISRSVGTAMNTSQSAASIEAPTSGGRARRMLGGCPSNHVGSGERSGGCERGARSSLLRRAFRHASSVVAAFPALAPRLIRLARHGYSDRLLVHQPPDPVPAHPAVGAVPRPVDDERLPLDVADRHRTPEARVVALLAVVAHDEDVAR